MTEQAEHFAKELASIGDDRSDRDDALLATDLKWALVGGSIAAALSLLGALSVGRLSGAKALILVEQLLPTARFLSSGVMAAAATILALMLTLLSLAQGTSSQLKPVHYKRVRRISLLTVIALVGSILLLSFLIVPIGEAETIPASMYDIVYYILLITSAALSGLFTTVILMLYRAVRALIEVVSPGEAEDLTVSEE